MTDPAAVATRSADRSLLIVEDDKAFVARLARALEARGFVVTTAETVADGLEQVEKRWKTKLEEGKDSAYMSYDLARIKTDVKLKFDLEKAKAHDFDASKVVAFFEQLEFKTLIKALDKITGATASAPMPAAKGQQISMFASEAPAVYTPKVQSNLETVIVDTQEKLAGLVKELNAEQVR